MIDFRYHLVSLIAVFLAVALGIVIGTTQLNQPILTDIRSQVKSLEQDKRALENQTKQLKSDLGTAEAFEQAVAPALVKGGLTGRKVLLVVSNDQVSQDDVDQLTTLVGQAGGAVSGTLRLKAEYSDPSTASKMQSYVTGSGLPPGVQLPETGDVGKLVGSLLAQVLMIPSVGRVPDTAAISSVTAGLTALNVLSIESDSITPADYAVVLTAGAFGGNDAGNRNAVLVDLVSALDAASSGAVIAGDTDSAGKNGLVGVVRGDPTLSQAVSTVDNVDTASGQISTVLALGRERAGTSGKYGTGDQAQPVPPIPAATP